MSIELLNLVLTVAGFTATVISVLYGFQALKSRDDKHHEQIMTLVDSLARSRPSYADKESQ